MPQQVVKAISTLIMRDERFCNQSSTDVLNNKHIITSIHDGNIYDIACSCLPDHVTQQDPTITTWRQLNPG
ncbi:hypothetical protein QQG55_14180 [Brugia pahangi]